MKNYYYEITFSNVCRDTVLVTETWHSEVIIKRLQKSMNLTPSRTTGCSLLSNLLLVITVQSDKLWLDVISPN